MILGNYNLETIDKKGRVMVIKVSFPILGSDSWRAISLGFLRYEGGGVEMVTKVYSTKKGREYIPETDWKGLWKDVKENDKLYDRIDLRLVNGATTVMVIEGFNNAGIHISRGVGTVYQPAVLALEPGYIKWNDIDAV